MVVVKANPQDTADSLIRKFTKKVALSGLLQELSKREYYQKPSEVRKEKMKAVQRRKYAKRTSK